jgi:hypothetical protein
MILLCYDGSSDAQCAIDRAGELLRGQPATILTLWDGLAAVLARAGTGVGIGALDFEAIDAASERSARQRAEEGVDPRDVPA